METIERYFSTLRMLLPADQRDDIVRELSEEIESQVADKEAALGRRADRGRTGGHSPAVRSPARDGRPLPAAAAPDRSDRLPLLLDRAEGDARAHRPRPRRRRRRADRGRRAARRPRQSVRERVRQRLEGGRLDHARWARSPTSGSRGLACSSAGIPPSRSDCLARTGRVRCRRTPPILPFPALS